jgi:transposase
MRPGLWQTPGVKTISLDWRERMLAAYDADAGTREAVAARFRVSLGMVKKLLQQRRRTGDGRPQHHRSGRKPGHVARHQHPLRALVQQKPELTLKALRAAAGLNCTLPAIHDVLNRLGLPYKKRRSAPVNQRGPTSTRRGGDGSVTQPAGIRPGWSSLMNRGRKPL